MKLYLEYNLKKNNIPLKQKQIEQNHKFFIKCSAILFSSLAFGTPRLITLNEEHCYCVYKPTYRNYIPLTFCIQTMVFNQNEYKF